MTRPSDPFGLDGTELAGYLVHSLIDRGGMAYVYRAEDRHLGRTVALKVLAPELANNEDFRQRFLRESRLAASLDHPNIIPIYDAGEARHMLYIAMRYVEGSDLKALLGEGRQLDARRVVNIFSQVAAALDAAHADGLVHRDVKPANILISPSAVSPGTEHVYLTDFGVTKRLAAVTGVTAAGVIVGTRDYLAPEQISGKPVSAQTDVYALGCVVYQALTGSVPFVRDNDAALFWAHLVEALPQVSQRRPDLPPTVQDVLAKATAKAPEERYPSCGEFIAALTDELHAGVAVSHPRPVDDRVPRRKFTDARTAPNLSGRPQTVHDQSKQRPASEQVDPSVAAARPRRRRRKVLGVLVGLIALAIAVVGLRMLLVDGTPTKRYTGNDLVPVSFSYPADWREAGTGTNVVFSPHAQEFLLLFAQAGQVPDWADAGRVLHDDPKGAVGLYTFFVRTQYPSATGGQQEVLQSLLPAKVTFIDAQSSVPLGQSSATRITGVLSDPTNSTARLRFACYIARITTGEPRTVHLIFFSSDDSFDRNRATFDRIAKSVELAH